MTCLNCKHHLSLCQCPDVTSRLQRLIESSYVYVGNIIEARIASGLSKPGDFIGNIHAPFASLEEARGARTLADVVGGRT